MFPEQFFFDMVLQILKIFALACGTLLLAAGAYCLYRARRRRTLLSIEEAPASQAAIFTDQEKNS
jgi:hypothetical protein